MFSDIATFAGAFLALGIADVVTPALIDLLKRVGVVEDGTSKQWAFGANLVFFAAFGLGGLLVPDFDAQGAAGVLTNIANILAGVLALIASPIVTAAGRAIQKKTGAYLSYGEYRGL